MKKMICSVTLVMAGLLSAAPSYAQDSCQVELHRIFDAEIIQPLVDQPHRCSRRWIGHAKKLVRALEQLQSMIDIRIVNTTPLKNAIRQCYVDKVRD